MPPKVYELRVFRGATQVPYGSPLWCVLDLLGDPEELHDLLNRHLYAAAQRSGARPEEAYLFHLDVYQVDQWAQPFGEPVLRWALPTPSEEVRRWR